MKKVCLFLFDYLPYTQSFIFEPLLNLRLFSPCIYSFIVRKNYFLNNPWRVYYKYKEGFFSSTLLNYSQARYFRSTAIRRLLEYHSQNIYGILRDNEVSVLHSHFCLDGYYACLIKKRCRLPLVVSLHGGYDTKVIINSNGFPRKDFFDAVDLFTVPSIYSKNNLLAAGCDAGKIKVLKHGIYPSSFQRNEDNYAVKLLIVARMTEKKGIIDAIQAFVSLKDVFARLRLTIVAGSQESLLMYLKKLLFKMGMKFSFNSQLGYREKVLRRIKELDCGQDIDIIYGVENVDVRKIMSEQDIFLLPSKTAIDGDEEGLPVSLLEAQAAGMPVITTRHAGNPEAVIDGDTGFVVDEGDIGAITKKLRMLIENPQLRRRMGQRGKEYVESEYSMEAHIKNLEDIYQNIIPD